MVIIIVKPKIRVDDTGFKPLYFCEKNCRYIDIYKHHQAKCEGLNGKELVFHDDFHAKCVYDSIEPVETNYMECATGQLMKENGFLYDSL